jgi:hypothetical protein
MKSRRKREHVSQHSPEIGKRDPIGGLVDRTSPVVLMP